MTAQKKAVILLSGGLDSATLVALAKAQKFTVYGLSFCYGQRNIVEIQAAKRVAKNLGMRDHKIIDIDLGAFGGSALTDTIAVPKNRSFAEMESNIPVTYVPARNTVFLSLALAYAEVIGAKNIFIGVNAVDYSGYPDCRPAFIEAYENLANIATRASVEDTQKLVIEAPLLHMTKREIIAEGTKHGVDYSMTVSCYDPDHHGRACGACDSCLLRAKGFEAAGVGDPTHYTDQAIK